MKEILIDDIDLNKNFASIRIDMDTTEEARHRIENAFNIFSNTVREIFGDTRQDIQAP